MAPPRLMGYKCCAAAPCVCLHLYESNMAPPPPFGDVSCQATEALKGLLVTMATASSLPLILYFPNSYLVSSLSAECFPSLLKLLPSFPSFLSFFPDLPCQTLICDLEEVRHE